MDQQQLAHNPKSARRLYNELCANHWASANPVTVRCLEILFDDQNVYLVLEKMECNLDEFIEDTNYSILNHGLKEEQVKHIISTVMLQSLFAEIVG